MPAYAFGAVSEPRDLTLQSRLDELQTEFPISIEHRRVLRELGSEFVYAAPNETGERSARTWLVLLRFGAVLESRFGFTREIPVIYSPFADLQIRTTDSLEKYLAKLPPDRRSISNNEALVWAPDIRLSTKLDSWSRPSRLLIPLPDKHAVLADDRVQQFITTLATRLASRDLYSARGYVVGEQFFGRVPELQQVRDCIRTREVVGIFGLRKTGKTSLLHEIIRAHDEEQESDGIRSVLVYQDLEYLPSLAEDPIPDLIHDLAENIRRRLKERNLRTQELADLPSPATPTTFRRALDSLLEKLDGKAKVVLLLDEIEYLCPPNPGPDTSSEGFQRVRQLLGGMRKLVQERDNFGFVIAGLANSVIESAHLYGAPNPLFSYARPMYLRPFSRDEAEALLNNVGKKVSLYWSPEAVDRAYDLSGGHALLLRDLASAVLNDQKNARSNIVQVKPGHIERVRLTWQQNVASHVREVLPHLETYYKEEAELAIFLMEEPASFVEYAAEYPDQIGRLDQLGIIRPLADAGWEPSRLLRFSYSHNNKRKVGVRNVGSLPLDSDQVATLTSLEEGEHLERKETLRSHSAKIPDEVIVDQVLKACLGLLNRSGGHVLVGVADSGTVVGLGRDLHVSGSQDKLIRFLTDKIRDKIGNVGLDLVHVAIHSVGQQQVLVLEVSAAFEPVFPKKPVDGKMGLFVRNNNTTRLLADQDAVQYVRRQWP